MTWRLRSRVKTSESKRGLVMTSVRRSSTLSRVPGSATALARWTISSLNRNFSSWSSMAAMVAPAIREPRPKRADNTQTVGLRILRERSALSPRRAVAH